MKSIKHARFFFWLLLLGFLGLSGCLGDSPGAPVEDFYRLYLKTHPIGLPTQEQEQAMSPYLSGRLLALIDKARSYQETFKRKYPDDKPPWIEGCLFASLFEGPTRFKVSNIVANADGTSTVKVHFWYETSGDQKFDWEDSVIVRRETKGFVIDDFVMSGAGPFNPARRLSEELKYRSD
jgi:hypothetical protein